MLNIIKRIFRHSFFVFFPEFDGLVDHPELEIVQGGFPFIQIVGQLSEI